MRLLDKVGVHIDSGEKIENMSDALSNDQLPLGNEGGKERGVGGLTRRYH
jgi:hypothetical protein